MRPWKPDVLAITRMSMGRRPASYQVLPSAITTGAGQRAEGAGTDIVAADETKPIQPLVVAEMDSLDRSVHGSGPTVFGNLPMRTNNVQKSMPPHCLRADTGGS